MFMKKLHKRSYPTDKQQGSYSYLSSSNPCNQYTNTICHNSAKLKRNSCFFSKKHCNGIIRSTSNFREKIKRTPKANIFQIIPKPKTLFKCFLSFRSQNNKKASNKTFKITCQIPKDTGRYLLNAIFMQVYGSTPKPDKFNKVMLNPMMITPKNTILLFRFIIYIIFSFHSELKQSIKKEGQYDPL